MILHDSQQLPSEVHRIGKVNGPGDPFDLLGESWSSWELALASRVLADELLNKVFVLDKLFIILLNTVGVSKFGHVLLAVSTELQLNTGHSSALVLISDIQRLSSGLEGLLSSLGSSSETNDSVIDGREAMSASQQFSGDMLNW